MPSSETDYRLVTVDTATGAVLHSPTLTGGASAFFMALAYPPPVATVVTVTIDIRPRSINPRVNGVIPVAILTTASFDAATVDVATVRFGPGLASEAHGVGHIDDVDGNGDLDLMLHFQTLASAIPCGATSATLAGSTDGGPSFTGSDTFVTVGCK